MNRADEVLHAIPSDVASKLWGNDKAPTNVLIQSEDGRTFWCFFKRIKRKVFLFHGWSNTTFKLTFFIDGVSRTSFWTSLVSTTSNLISISIGAGCYLLFTRGFGNYFHLRILGKKSVEINFSNVEVDEPVVASIDSVAEPAIDGQQDGRHYKFVRMASTDFRLPDNVSRMAKLDSDLKPITVRLQHLTQQEEFTNRTRSEKKEKGFRYA
ncbi:hypothetical protein Hanom_Chr13g01192971 [Helianthus anomalus]